MTPPSHPATPSSLDAPGRRVCMFSLLTPHARRADFLLEGAAGLKGVGEQD
jgi:hypothetical protein